MMPKFGNGNGSVQKTKDQLYVFFENFKNLILKHISLSMFTFKY